MCGNCHGGVSGVRDGDAVYCGDCTEGLELEIGRLRNQKDIYDVTLARYSGLAVAWQLTYAERIAAARAHLLDRIEGETVRATELGLDRARVS